MYRDWNDRVKLSCEFLERLPKRVRRLVRRVGRYCCSEHYWQKISFYDWTLFMTFLARECQNLQSLKLWGPGNRREGPGCVETCKEDAEWVQAILQIKSLIYFDIPVIRNGLRYDNPEFANDFFPWLKSRLQRKSLRWKPLEALHTALDLNCSSIFHFLKYRAAFGIVYADMLCSLRTGRSPLHQIMVRPYDTERCSALSDLQEDPFRSGGSAL